jgi:hypothetical protein
VISRLLNNIEPGISDICMSAGSAQGIWQKVERRFGQKNKHARIFQLQTELHQVKKQPNDLTSSRIIKMKFNYTDQPQLTLITSFNSLQVLIRVMKPSYHKSFSLKICSLSTKLQTWLNEKNQVEQ